MSSGRSASTTPRLLHRERPRRLHPQQPHRGQERRRLDHRPVRRLRPHGRQLPADHRGLELHGAPVPPGPRDPERRMGFPRCPSHNLMSTANDLILIRDVSAISATRGNAGQQRAGSSAPGRRGHPKGRCSQSSRSSTWPRPSARGIRHWCCWRPSPACGGASWPVWPADIGPWFLDTFGSATGLDSLHYAILLPPVELCLERVRCRADHGFKDLEAARHMHRAFTDTEVASRHVLDSTGDATALASRPFQRMQAGLLRRSIRARGFEP